MPRVLLVALAAGLVLAGCGGTSTDQTPGADQARVVIPDATPAASGPPAERPRPPKVETGNRPSRPTAQANAEKPDSSPPTGTNPCSLVTRSQARAIVGRDVSTPILAPQGPTCIYNSGRESVTIAVETHPIAVLRKRNPKSVKVQVAGRTGYCVTSPQLALLVPIDSGSTLTIGAACPVAARFATEALS